MSSRTLAIFLIGLAGATWTDAETVDVENRGTLALKPYACQDITRSSLVNRVCYDAANRSMIVQVKAVYLQHCDVPQTMLEAFLSAPSMGQYYKATIARSAPGGPHECEPHRAAKH